MAQFGALKRWAAFNSRILRMILLQSLLVGGSATGTRPAGILTEISSLERRDHRPWPGEMTLGGRAFLGTGAAPPVRRDCDDHQVFSVPGDPCLLCSSRPLFSWVKHSLGRFRSKGSIECTNCN